MNNYEYLSNTEKELLSRCPYSLTLTIETLTKPSAKKYSNVEPPRPPNCWILFLKDFTAKLHLNSPDIKRNVKDTTKECSLKWKSQPSDVIYFFKILEKIASKNHGHIYPNYKYKPKKTKGSSYKKIIFREQRKYIVTSSAKSSSMNDNPFQGGAESNTSPSTTQYKPQSASIENLSDDNDLLDKYFDIDIDINNNLIFTSGPISTIPDTKNTASIATTPFNSSPPEYLTYDFTYRVGNLSNINCDICNSINFSTNYINVHSETR
ncbi:13583_t:CDS:1 [Ambispora gerdemannii]|uniref:13583_t:CDS:1 n=1 Tax=Ambispora gerdemannii TaxID=144530 RepID=A0A9N9BJH1_9GLOM|nr:13583_t:CDS:1 [Ambispora gerdemannii]